MQGEPAETPLSPPTDSWPTSLESAAGLTGRVLWVDDHPTNNAYEIAALKARGVEVDVATSTSQALQILVNEPGYDALVADLRRTEEGADNPTAGLTLLRESRGERPRKRKSA